MMHMAKRSALKTCVLTCLVSCPSINGCLCSRKPRIILEYKKSTVFSGPEYIIHSFYQVSSPQLTLPSPPKLLHFQDLTHSVLLLYTL